MAVQGQRLPEHQLDPARVGVASASGNRRPRRSPRRSRCCPRSPCWRARWTARGIALAGQHASHIQIVCGTVYLCGLAGLQRNTALIVADGAVGACNELPVGSLGVDANRLSHVIHDRGATAQRSNGNGWVTKCRTFFSWRKTRRSQAAVRRVLGTPVRDQSSLPAHRGTADISYRDCAPPSSRGHQCYAIGVTSTRCFAITLRIALSSCSGV